MNRRLHRLLIVIAATMIVFACGVFVNAETTPSYVSFGSYPQREVVGEASQSGVYGNSYWGTTSTTTNEQYIVDSSLYATLKGLSEDKWDSNGDTTVGGNKYHRLLKGQATYGTSGNSYYYNWSDSATYHYFKYEQIKWRVLKSTDDDAFLLCDMAIDDQKYNTSGTTISWEQSTVRSWLNSYGSSSNGYGTDYSSKGFYKLAFSNEEKSAIKTTSLVNANNKQYGTSGGNNTEDKIFLLSEDEVYGSNATQYGFASSNSSYDTARQMKSSSYAKAMGVCSNTNSSYLGNCSWWLRSPGEYTNNAANVNNIGDVSRYGSSVVSSDDGILPALHVNPKSITGWTGSDEDENYVSGNIKVSYNPQMKKLKENVITEHYSDDFFSYDNSKYHKDLARFSLVTTMASMSKWTSNKSEREEHIKELFVDKLKFENYKSKKYNVTLDNSDDTVGYAFACKDIDGDNVMAIAIRSGGYGSEWESNGHVVTVDGDSDGEHDGFGAAADDVYSAAVSYAEKNDIDKIWISGYSRGGAVSGILANKLVSNGVVDKENMYCYTFEAPQSTTKIKNTRGVYNTVSLSDLIPMVPLSKWGFTRYGKNIFISSTKASGKAYSKNLSSVQTEFRKLTGNDYQTNSRLLNEAIVKIVGDVVPTQTNYLVIQPAVMRLLGTMGTEKVFIGGKTDPYNYTPLLEYFHIDQIYDLREETNWIAQQHWPEATYAWLKYGDTTETNIYKTVSYYGTINVFNHLADLNESELKDEEKLEVTDEYTIEVYDSEGKKVAEIKNGEYESFIEDNPDTSLEVLKGLNGEIQILIPEDSDYRFELVANKELTMNYTVNEYQGEGELTRQIQYNDIELNKNDTMSGNSEQGVNLDAQTYNPELNNNATIVADVVASGDALNAVNVEVETVGNGLGIGAGSYADGAKVVLTATAFDKDKFVGWYEGETLLSENESYEFTAEAGSDRAIRAEFTDKGKGIREHITNIFSEDLTDIRLAGSNRYDTALKSADTYKKALGVDKFDNAVVACGTNFPDALAGGYLAKLANAPVLLTEPSQDSNIVNYIKNNVEAGGTIYVLGGTNSVSANFKTSVEKAGYTCERLGGSDRYETNLLILNKCNDLGADFDDLLVSTGANYPDSLSASATGRPILLVGGDSLNAKQKAYLNDLDKDTNLYVLGGEKAVSAKIKREIEGILNGSGVKKRLAGDSRYETSTMIAETFFKKEGADVMVFAVASNFPDGLSGSSLAMALGAPIVLTSTDNITAAKDVRPTLGATKSIALGGAALISDAAVKKIMGK